MWQHFLQARLQKHPEMKENSNTGYAFSTKTQEIVEGGAVLGAPFPHQLLTKTKQKSDH